MTSETFKESVELFTRYGGELGKLKVFRDSLVCPECGQRSVTKRGVATHRSRAHGVRGPHYEVDHAFYLKNKAGNTPRVGRRRKSPSVVTDEMRREIVSRVQAGERIKRIALQTGISKSAIYSYVRDFEGKGSQPIKTVADKYSSHTLPKEVKDSIIRDWAKGDHTKRELAEKYNVVSERDVEDVVSRLSREERELSRV